MGRDIVVDLGKRRHTGSILATDAFDFDEAHIPLRPWIIKGLLLRKHTHMLVAPGGSGKSLLTLQLAIALGTGQAWAGWQPVKRCRTLVLNVEDDIDEQHRRLAAARRHMQAAPEMLEGMVWLAEDADSMIVAKIDPVRKHVTATPIIGALRTFIEDHAIDVLMIDPFAETFEGDENSNSEVKWAMKLWRDAIARATGCAVLLVHHTPKYSSANAGNADAVRGASAIVNSTRISSTLFPMSLDDAKAMGIEPAKRNRFIRFDDAKANQTLVSTKARWFEKISIPLLNGTTPENGDEVGVLHPWYPPSPFDGHSLDAIRETLTALAAGVPDENGKPSGVLYSMRPYTKDGMPGERWAGWPVMRHLGVNQATSARILREWSASGLIFDTDYLDPNRRKLAHGIAVDGARIPGPAEPELF